MMSVFLRFTMMLLMCSAFLTGKTASAMPAAEMAMQAIHLEVLHPHGGYKCNARFPSSWEMFSMANYQKREASPISSQEKGSVPNFFQLFVSTANNR